MKPQKIHPEALEEYNQAAADYAAIYPELGQRFYHEIRRLIAEIQRAPTLYRHFDGIFQRNFSTTFPFSVIYVQEPEHIHIIAVMHMHRKPGYWKHRLQ